MPIWEIKIRIKIWSQNKDIWELTIVTGHINYQCPTSSIILGDFNAKCLKWCSSDKTNRAGLEFVNNIITIVGYSQVIIKPTHFVNDTSSCIDLQTLSKSVELSSRFMENVIII